MYPRYTPVRKKMASSSVSVSVAAPNFSNFSRGGIHPGHAFIPELLFFLPQPHYQYAIQQTSARFRFEKYAGYSAKLA